MLYAVSADALQLFRLMLDTPAHEGAERGRARLLLFWVGKQLVKTEARATKGVIRKKNAKGRAPRH